MSPTYIMKTRKLGLMKYWLIAVFPFLVVCFLLGPDAAAWVFLPLAVIILIAKDHTIAVFEHSLTEKDFRGRFIRNVNATQIATCRRNALGEIILMDFDSKVLLRIESNMTNRDRFEQWLTAHNIESK